MFPWSGRQKGTYWESYLFCPRTPIFIWCVVSRTCINLHENLMQETCASFLTVCHHDYTTISPSPTTSCLDNINLQLWVYGLLKFRNCFSNKKRRSHISTPSEIDKAAPRLERDGLQSKDPESRLHSPIPLHKMRPVGLLHITTNL